MFTPFGPVGVLVSPVGGQGRDCRGLFIGADSRHMAWCFCAGCFLGLLRGGRLGAVLQGWQSCGRDQTHLQGGRAVTTGPVDTTMPLERGDRKCLGAERRATGSGRGGTGGDLER